MSKYPFMTVFHSCLLIEEEGLGEKVELPLERETEGFEKNQPLIRNQS